MAKINTALKDYKEAFSHLKGITTFFSIEHNDKNKLVEFINLFDSVIDDRKPGMCKYPAKNIVIITFLSIFEGSTTWEEVEDFGNDNIELLNVLLDMTSGVPSHDTFRRVFSLINSSSLEDIIIEFLKKASSNILDEFKLDDNYDLLPIDGKELRRTGRKYDTSEKIKNAQIMNFYDASSAICIKSELIDDKTNEIPVAQHVLSNLNLQKKIITADAMNCQKKTAEVIINNKGNYVFGLKKNHKDFFISIEETFKKNIENESIKGTKNYIISEIEKSHNQIETREYFRLDASNFIQDEDFKDLNSVVCYRKKIYNLHKETTKYEHRYYISNLKDISLISQAIRGHWAIENNLHWNLDKFLGEDTIATIDKNASLNLSLIKKMALTLLELMQPIFGKISKNRIIKRFRRKYDLNLFKLFAFLDGYDLEKLKKVK